MQGKSGKSIFDLYQSESPLATELRRLYHNIMTYADNRRRAYLVTSSNRGEGKSTITAYLALAMAQFPKNKVLVIDADLRRPRLHQLFGLSPGRGLSECLTEGADPMAVLQDTKMPNLKVITAGGHHDSPARLFESGNLVDFFGKVKFYFDLVLVDSAPVMPVSDVLFLCTKLDSVLFVVLAGVTPRQVVMRAKEILEDSRAQIAGVVVNNASRALPYYYDYRYYGYGHKGQ